MINQKILLIGGTGLLGYYWINYKSNKKKLYVNIHKNKKKSKDINYINLNLNNFNSLKKYIERKKIKTIVNMAAMTNIEECEKYKKKAFKINVKIPELLSRLAKLLKIRYVYISTDQLFSGLKKIYTEKDYPNPLNYYAKTKAESEREILKIYNKSLIIRTNFFCLGQNIKHTFLDQILKSLKSNKKIYLWDNFYFSPIYTKNLIKIIMILIKKKKSGIYNISTNERISRFDYANLVAEKFELNKKLLIKKKFNKNKFVNRPKNMTLSNKKIKKIIKNKNIFILKNNLNDLKKDFDKYI